MEEILVPIRGGSGAYEIRLACKENGLTISCDCQAGKFNKLCKHKLGILSGEYELVENLCERSANKVKALVQAALSQNAKQYIDLYFADIRSLEAEKERIEKQIKERKAALAKQMAEGFPKVP